MAKPKKEDIEEEVSATPEESGEVEEKKEATKATKRDSVTVSWNGGKREYTRALHGDGFEDLANEFATKKKGTIS